MAFNHVFITLLGNIAYSALFGGLPEVTIGIKLIWKVILGHIGSYVRRGCGEEEAVLGCFVKQGTT